MRGKERVLRCKAGGKQNAYDIKARGEYWRDKDLNRDKGQGDRSGVKQDKNI